MDNNSLHQQLGRLEEKMSRLDGHFDDLLVNVIENTKDLKYHIRRTNLIEQRLNHVEEIWDELKAHIRLINLVIKAATVISVIGGVAYGILQYINL